MKTYTHDSFGSEGKDDLSRFLLHFGQVGVDEEQIQHQPIQAWAFNKTIHILNPENSKGEIKILSIFGQQIEKARLTGNTNQQIQLNVSTGCYLVRVMSENGVVTRKVVVE